MGICIKHERVYKPKLFNRKGKFITVSGVEIDILNFKEEDVDLLDIAHALSMVCRSGGHVEEFFSVAQHAVEVARLLQERGYSNDVVLQGLHHDDSEAYLGDVISPLKELLPGYRKIENDFQATISGALGLDYPFHPAVHKADKDVFVQEVKDTKWPQAERMLIPLSCEDAYKEYLDMHYSLTNRGR